MSRVKGSAVIGLVLFALIPLIDAACWQGFNKAGSTHCKDNVDKTWHAVGSSWTNSKCDKCSCTAEMISCCHGLPTSVKFPDDCTVEYDYHTCTFEVFNKKDRSIPCPHSAVGK